MPTITIPEQHVEGLLKLISLPAERADELLGLIRETPSGLYHSKKLREVASTAKGIAKADSLAIVDALSSIYAALARREIKVGEFVPDLVEAINKIDDARVEDAVKNRALVEQRLRDFLNVEHIVIAFKALGILFANTNSFVRARTITDIRPVFGPDVHQAPAAAMIVHNLKLEYLTSGSEQEFFVTLDTNDVRYLIDILKRAEDKAMSLQKTLSDAKVHYLDPT